MKAMIAWGAALAMGCSSGSGSGLPSIGGTWVYQPSSGAGLGVTFDDNASTYVLQELVLTSSNSGDDQVETGTFTQNATEITFTPQKFSCPGPAKVHTISYQVANGDLSLVQPSGIVILQPDTSSSMSEAITIGCFASNGMFTVEPLAPVSN